jgi:type IV pilus assembly protein PilW
MKHDWLRTERQRGFSLVELMVGIVIGMTLIVGLTVTFANSSQSYGEMQKQAQQIENGRYAFDVLRDDLEHVGFLGSRTQLPPAPASAPNPCDTAIASLATAIALPIQAYDSPLTSPISACLASTDHVAGTDIVVVRRADPEITTLPIAQESYVQASLGGLEVQAGEPSGFVLPALNADNTVQAVGTKATGGVAPTVKKMMNVNLASPVITVARVAADIRKLHVHIYFVAPCSRFAPGQSTCTASADGGQPIPTLKRLELSVNAGAPALLVRSIAEGIENLQLDYGFDTTPTAVNLATGFPGDGVIDIYAKNLTGVGTATFPEWRNAMSARLYVLARNPLPTSGFTDDKTYAMGLEGTYTPAATSYRRHLFSGEVRLINLSSRREIPK